jgi:hypothetical protein
MSWLVPAPLVGRDDGSVTTGQALDGADDLLHAEAAERADSVVRDPARRERPADGSFESSCEMSHAQRRGCITITFGAANRVA